MEIFHKLFEVADPCLVKHDGHVVERHGGTMFYRTVHFLEIWTLWIYLQVHPQQLNLSIQFSILNLNYSYSYFTFSNCPNNMKRNKINRIYIYCPVVTEKSTNSSVKFTRKYSLGALAKTTPGTFFYISDKFQGVWMTKFFHGSVFYTILIVG